MVGDHVLLQTLKNILAVLCIITLSACSLPRGAALSSEILQEKGAEQPSYSVIHVTRSNMAGLATWPATGWTGRYHWLRNSRGPNSPVIRAGDRLSLVVWDNQENSLLAADTKKLVNMDNLVVSSAGTIFVPYLDNISVVGKTPTQARDLIQEEILSISPLAQVQLSFTSGKQNSVDLVTGVAKPGTYPLPDRNYSILSLLASGGGIAPKLRNPQVRLIRGGKTYETPAEVLFSDATKNITLRGNDKVLVQEDKRYFTALGATGRESLIYFDKENITTIEALSMIGGLSDARADLKGVLVLREYPTRALRSDGKGPEMQQVIFVFDLTNADGLFASRNFMVNPKDTILATESPVVKTRTILSLIGATIGIANNLD